jgi:hypothetical protein
VVGGAIGTADAIVTAPFRGDSYAYYQGPRPYGDTYAYYGERPVVRRTTCGVQPGATYLGPDGRWYPLAQALIATEKAAARPPFY